MKSTFLTTTLSLGVIALVSLTVPSTVYAGLVIIKHNKRVAIPAVKHRPSRNVYKNAHHYSKTVVREGTSSSGRTCREFQQRVAIGGKLSKHMEQRV